MGEGAVGIIPALNQLALALGIILLLPSAIATQIAVFVLFCWASNNIHVGHGFAKNILLFATASTFLAL